MRGCHPAVADNSDIKFFHESLAKCDPLSPVLSNSFSSPAPGLPCRLVRQSAFDGGQPARTWGGAHWRHWLAIAISNRQNSYCEEPSLLLMSMKTILKP